MATAKKLAIKYRNPAELKPHPRNARTHSSDQVERIAYSIQRFGWTNPIIVDDRDRIVAGHGRQLAALKLALAEVPVIEHGKMSDAEVRAYILADNRLAELAGWDKNLLRLELGDLQGFEGLLELGLSDMMPAEEVEPEELDLKPIDFDNVGDTFWIVIRGPLRQQAGVLQTMREATKDIEGVRVELGTQNREGEGLL